MELSKNQLNKFEIDRDIARDTRKRLLEQLQVQECKLDAIRHLLQSDLTNEQKINGIKGVMM